MKKVVYIAGPYRGANNYEIHRNVCAAEEHAFAVWKMGAVALCPHLNTANFQFALPDEDFLQGDLELLSRCDAMLATGRWFASKGTVNEINFANSRGIPVFYHVNDLEDWLKVTPPAPSGCALCAMPDHAGPCYPELRAAA